MSAIALRTGASLGKAGEMGEGEEVECTRSSMEAGRL